jgi:YD repeat-containing protein
MACHRITTGGLILLLCIFPATVALGETLTYTYDTMDRLATVQYANGTTVVYTYDKMGNRLGMQVTPPTQAPGQVLTPLHSSGDASVREVTGPGSSATSVAGGSATAPVDGSKGPAGVSPLPGLQVFLDRLPRVGSVSEAERLQVEAFEYLDSSGLSPEDKASYKQEFSQSLGQKAASLTAQAEAAGAAGPEKPGPTAAAHSQGKDTKPEAPVQKNKISVDQEKIYTRPPAKDE